MNNKPITKYVILRVTYDSFIHEPPRTWDWNNLAEIKEGENIELISESDIPIIPKNLF